MWHIVQQQNLFNGTPAVMSSLKPGFHYLPDRLDRPSRLEKNVQTIRTIIWKHYFYYRSVSYLVF